MTMTRRLSHPSPLAEAWSSMRIIVPSLGALLVGVSLLQVAPMVLAATNPPIPVIKPLPMLSAPRAYPAKYPIVQTMQLAAPIQFGDWAWNETGAPLTGPVLVVVDIASESVAVFRSGHQVGMTRMIYGDDEKPTPVGIFPITQKSEKHRSNIFVDAPMPYMLRMTNDGISVHGTDKVQPIYATNGCIGIPNEFAKRLFDIVALGDRIVVTKARTLQNGDVVPTA